MHFGVKETWVDEIKFDFPYIYYFLNEDTVVHNGEIYLIVETHVKFDPKSQEKKETYSLNMSPALQFV